MAFNHLPVEVIDNICLLFRNPKSGPYRCDPGYQPLGKKALVNLCRTSKQLLHVARPHLYYHVNINGHEASLVPFTRLLFDNPHLAPLVREIELDEYRELDHDQVLEDYFSIQSPLLPTPDRGADRTLIGSEEWYAVHVLGLLLTRARNLEFIDITDTPDDVGFGPDGFAQIKEKHMADPEFLSNLKDLVIRDWDTEGGFDFDTIVPLLNGTQIQTLTLHSCTGIQELDNCSFPSLLDLKILNSGLDEIELATIIKWCPNLHHFTYGVGSPTVTEGKDLATPEEITSALLPLRKNLRTLSLWLPFEDIYTSDPIGPLVHFSRLESLTIDINALAGETNCDYDEWTSSSLEERDLKRKKSLSGWLGVLPKSLQKLCILQPTKALHSELSILAGRSTDFPNLRTLVICGESLDCQALFRDTKIEYIEPGHPRYVECSKNTLWDEEVS